ncbi:MAG: CcdB family protein [Burkholderiaceae bacterium]|jgi:toxin CcdB|nr:CcdB family protein [Burkholderiaceae bacterium]
MPQFDVYANPNSGSRASVPFVVDVQSNLIDALPTRLVMPLSRVGAEQARLPSNLCPPVTLEDEVLTLMPHLAAPVDRRLLRHPVRSLAHRAHDISAALDAVVSGV